LVRFRDDITVVWTQIRTTTNQEPTMYDPRGLAVPPVEREVHHCVHDVASIGFWTRRGR
jgi:hypothetical protein